MNKGDIPDQGTPKGKSQPRQPLTKEQFAKLFETSVARLAEAASQPDIFYQRGVLHCFINLAVETGMRPVEIFNLDCGHIEGAEDLLHGVASKERLRILAYGKGKSPKPLTPGPNIGTVLFQMQQLQMMQFGKAPTRNTPVFLNKAGQRMQNVKKSLAALFDAAGLEDDGFGWKFTAYCFRHTYATWQLQDPTVVSFKLSKNMRTGAKVIEDYYGHVDSDTYAAIFRGDHKW